MRNENSSSSSSNDNNNCQKIVMKDNKLKIRLIVQIQPGSRVETPTVEIITKNMPKNLIEDDQASSPKRADSGVQIFSSSDMLKINDDQAARLSDKNEMLINRISNMAVVPTKESIALDSNVDDIRGSRLVTRPKPMSLEPIEKKRKKKQNGSDSRKNTVLINYTRIPPMENPPETENSPSIENTGKAKKQ